MMRERFDDKRRRALSALVIALIGSWACNPDDTATPDAKRVAPPAKAAAPASRQAGGEVIAVLDRNSEPVPVKWMGDDNILALARLLNTRVKAAADYELQQWGSDTTRAFAAEMAREHAAMRYTIDSVATTLGLNLVLPALGFEIDSVTTRQLTMLNVPGGRPLDRAYVRQQIASHEYMLDYLTKFAAAAERQELRPVIDTLRAKVKRHLAAGRALQAQYARADSAKAAADSARRSRRRNQ
jgi:predicted outer membrane protein